MLHIYIVHASYYSNTTPNWQTLREFHDNDEFCQKILANPIQQNDFTIKDGLVKLLEKNPKCFFPPVLGVASQAMTNPLTSIRRSRFLKCDEICFTLGWKNLTKNALKAVYQESSTRLYPGLWQQSNKPSGILHSWYIGHAGPVVHSGGCAHILIRIDEFSKYSSRRLEKTISKF